MKDISADTHLEEGRGLILFWHSLTVKLQAEICVNDEIPCRFVNAIKKRTLVVVALFEARPLVLETHPVPDFLEDPKAMRSKQLK